MAIVLLCLYLPFISYMFFVVFRVSLRRLCIIMFFTFFKSRLITTRKTEDLNSRKKEPGISHPASKMQRSE